jgi:hypothetical protein
MLRLDRLIVRAIHDAHYFANPVHELSDSLAQVQIRGTLRGEYARWAKALALTCPSLLVGFIGAIERSPSMAGDLSAFR